MTRARSSGSRCAAYVWGSFATTGSRVSTRKSNASRNVPSTRLKDAGAELIDTELPDLARLIELTTDQVQNHDVRFALARYLKEYGTGLTLEQLVERASPDIQSRLSQRRAARRRQFRVRVGVCRGARSIPAGATPAVSRSTSRALESPQSCFPPMRVAAPLIGEETTLQIRGRAVPFEDAVARNIAPGSTAGLPGLVLPAGLTSGGLPVALEFDGARRERPRIARARGESRTGAGTDSAAASAAAVVWRRGRWRCS